MAPDPQDSDKLDSRTIRESLDILLQSAASSSSLADLDSRIAHASYGESSQLSLLLFRARSLAVHESVNNLLFPSIDWTAHESHFRQEQLRTQHSPSHHCPPILDNRLSKGTAPPAV